jgi:hypothetical protein
VKIDLNLSGPKGNMWDNAITYHNLGDVYSMEVGAAVLNLASYIENITGGAGDSEPSYTFSLKCVGEVNEPKAATKSVKADRLLYSQALDIQMAGAQLYWWLSVVERAGFAVRSGGCLELTELGAFWLHLAQNQFALNYVNTLWTQARREPWPKRVAI